MSTGALHSTTAQCKGSFDAPGAGLGVPAYKIHARRKSNADKSVHKREDKYPVGDESQHLSGCGGVVAGSVPRVPGSGAEVGTLPGFLARTRDRHTPGWPSSHPA